MVYGSLFGSKPEENQGCACARAHVEVIPNFHVGPSCANIAHGKTRLKMIAKEGIVALRQHLCKLIFCR